MARWWAVALLAAASAGLWWLQGVAADYRMFDGRFGFALDLAASLTTAVLCVIAAAELVTGIGYAVFTAAEPTGFERAGAYVVLGCLAVLTVLSHFGVNVTTLLATSAVLTAVIGLALQPTLGALIAGFTMSADRLLKIGDSLVHAGETLKVTGIGWRSVAAVRPNGTRVVLSNNRIIDGTADIVSAGSASRAELSLIAPLSCEPHRVGDLVASVVSDIALVEPSRPVTVAPVTFDPEKAQVRYRVLYWVGSPDSREPAEEKIVTRLWYAFQREALGWPISTNFAVDHAQRMASLGEAPWRSRLEAMLAIVQQRTGAALMWDLATDDIIAQGMLLLYADGERMIVPDRAERSICILLHGCLTGDGVNQTARAPQRTGARRPHRGELQALSADLARSIGPFASFAVDDAALDANDLAQIRADVAREIEDDRQRRDFVEAIAAPVAGDRFGPGHILDLRRDALGVLQTSPTCRCDGPVAVVAIPERILQL